MKFIKLTDTSGGVFLVNTDKITMIVPHPDPKNHSCILSIGYRGDGSPIVQGVKESMSAIAELML